MWSKFGNCCLSMKGVIITSILWQFLQKKTIFLRDANVRKFCDLIFTFLEVKLKKLDRVQILGLIIQYFIKYCCHLRFLMCYATM